MSPSRVRPRIVLFDIDNTLCATAGAGRRALTRAGLEVLGQRLDRPPGAASSVSYAGRTDPLILRDVLRALGVEPTRALMDEIFARYVIHLAAELANGNAGHVLPGVNETIAALAGRPGVHIGLLTGNIARGAALKLRAHGLDVHFRFGAYGDDADERPDLLPIAIERWRAVCAPGGERPPPREDIWVVGDTVHDVGVARAHGARAVAVGTGAPFQDRAALLALRPDYFFEDLRAAGPFIENVLRT